jgi:Tfp pilus assembly protein PilZ
VSQDPRRDFSVPIPVELVRADGSRSVEYAVNLSPRGICLHVQSPLSVGEEVRIAFTLPPAGPSIDTAAKVVWTNHQGETGTGTRFWETGLHLQGVGEELHRVLVEYATQPTNRRR